MGSQALSGKFTVLELGTPAPPASATSWTSLTEVVSIGDFNMNRAGLDATSHGPGVFRDVIMGLADIIEQPLTLNYIEEQFQPLWDMFKVINATPEWFRLVFPDSTFIMYEAFVGAINVTTPIDGVITAEVTLKVTQDTVTYGTTA